MSMSLLVQGFPYPTQIFSGFFHFEPWPPKTEGRCKFIHMENPKAPKLLGAAHRFPIDLSLGPRGSFVCGPKEGSFNLVDIF
jgi:hypothetical protein